MGKAGAYRSVFAEGAADFLVQLPKRRQLAEHPFLHSDYRLQDESGREIEHLLIEDFVFAYWLDHAVREVRITDIEDAS